ncbi:uncharacterized protein LOC124120930 [Haliotis rufescens]|uniref:uncharacterized protein LOC124120930 n=1 Tax=Haliotis rufescens TaxID=6454 RepID=UPI00201F2CD3|nr:uncharacterized protein LOC124120930 [Haliotis rufescens]
MSDHMSELETLVTAWAWGNHIKPYYETKYSFGDFEFQVDLEKVDFLCEKPTFKYRKSPMLDPKVVFKSRYKNDTDEAQEMTIRVQRTTSATARIRVKNGFTADNGVGIKLRAPPEVDSAFGGYLPIKTEETSDLCHSMTWKYNSKITAAPRKTTVAKFEVNEERLVCDFSTYVSLKGKAKVTVVHKSSGTTIETIKESIRTIIDEYLPRATQYSRQENLIFIGAQEARWPFRGDITFNYGISQNEVVE